MQRSKQILNILLNKKRISTQNALRTWINFIWQCRVVDIQMHHNKNVHDLKNRVTHVTTDVRRSVREFRYKTLGSVIYHAKERGQRMAVTKAFYRWSLTSLKEANNELQNQLIIYQNQVGQELKVIRSRCRSGKAASWPLCDTKDVPAAVGTIDASGQRGRRRVRGRRSILHGAAPSVGDGSQNLATPDSETALAQQHRSERSFVAALMRCIVHLGSIQPYSTDARRGRRPRQ